MSDKVKTLDVKALLEKNPEAARVFEENRKKLGAAWRPRPQQEYKIGLPYTRPMLSQRDAVKRK